MVDVYERHSGDRAGYNNSKRWLTRSSDYAQLSGPCSFRDLTSEITNEYDTGSRSYPGNQGYNAPNDLWDTTLNSQGIPYGFGNQIEVSLGVAGSPTAPNLTWGQGPNTITQQIETDGFRVFYHLPPLYSSDPGDSQIIAEAESTNAYRGSLHAFGDSLSTHLVAGE